jgi:hypothetical protein
MAISAAVSVDQASPVVPLQYETAIRALKACTSLDDARGWNDMADLAAAAAKIAGAHELERQARRVKLHAYRRMGQLAAQLRPQTVKGVGYRGVMGRLPGPMSLLKEHGLSNHHADAARFLAMMSEEEFQELLNEPVAPTTVAARRRGQGGPEWKSFTRTATMLRACLRRYPPEALSATARRLGERQERALRDLTAELLCMLRRIEERRSDD